MLHAADRRYRACDLGDEIPQFAYTAIHRSASSAQIQRVLAIPSKNIFRAKSQWLGPAHLRRTGQMSDADLQRRRHWHGATPRLLRVEPIRLHPVKRGCKHNTMPAKGERLGQVLAIMWYYPDNVETH